VASETKFFEIRDNGTFIPAVASRYRVQAITDETERGHKLLRRAGWSYDNPPVTLTHLANRKASADPFEWSHGRTMSIAHQYIQQEWDSLESGQVIDVRVVMDETPKAVASEL